MLNKKKVENLQKEHYNRIAQKYQAHYNDKYGKYYREHMIYKPLVKNIDLKDKLVLEGMCGGGEATDFLIREGAKVIGLDISNEEIKIFKRNHPGCRGVAKSMLKTGFKSNTFDVVFIIGGFHHLVPFEHEGFKEVHRILKPGGYLCFMEPVSGTLVDVIRKWWYPRDQYFEKNEKALDVNALMKRYANKYKFIHLNYDGGFAYYLVLNTMIFRIPLWIKPFYSWPLLFLDRITSPLITKPLSAYANLVWQKK